MVRERCLREIPGEGRYIRQIFSEIQQEQADAFLGLPQLQG